MLLYVLLHAQVNQTGDRLAIGAPRIEGSDDLTYAHIRMKDSTATGALRSLATAFLRDPPGRRS